MYAHVMMLDVDIPSLNLFTRKAGAAFGLGEVLGGQDKLATLLATLPANEEDEEMKLEWDEELAELPAELKFLFEKVLGGERHLDLKIVLDSVPKWDSLPLKPPENNHKMDSKNFVDKHHKA